MALTLREIIEAFEQGDFAENTDNEATSDFFTQARAGNVPSFLMGRTFDPAALDLLQVERGQSDGLVNESLPGQSVSTGSMVARAGITPQGTPTDVAFGFELQQQMFQNLLAANADRRAAVDQTISTINLLSELERVSPTRAASFAASMGLGNGPDLGFVNNIDSGALARVSGRAGNQSISLPLSLTGKSLDFLGSNPNVANVVRDVADAIGLPDIFARSAASAIPTSRSLAALA